MVEVYWDDATVKKILSLFKGKVIRRHVGRTSHIGLASPHPCIQESGPQHHEHASQCTGQAGLPSEAHTTEQAWPTAQGTGIQCTCALPPWSRCERTPSALHPHTRCPSCTHSVQRSSGASRTLWWSTVQSRRWKYPQVRRGMGRSGPLRSPLLSQLPPGLLGCRRRSWRGWCAYPASSLGRAPQLVAVWTS